MLIGTGADEEARLLREAAAAAGPRVLIRMPGYRQGHDLRAIYAEATALVFPSLCESFGIPAVEAMAQGLPVALADSTALPEIGGEAGWYFDPLVEEAITASLRSLLDDHHERARRAALGRTIAAKYRWDTANDLLVEALATHSDLGIAERSMDARPRGFLGAGPRQETPFAVSVSGWSSSTSGQRSGNANGEAGQNQADGLLIVAINLLDPDVAVADQHGHDFRLKIDDPVFAQAIGEIFGSLGHVVALVRLTSLGNDLEGQRRRTAAAPIFGVPRRATATSGLRPEISRGKPKAELDPPPAR